MPGALYTMCTHVGAPVWPIPRTAAYRPPAGAGELPNPQAEALAATFL